MRELLLMRHAHAVPIAEDIADFDRPLTNAGRLEASQTARGLLATRHLPQCIVSSSARRSAETAAIVQEILQLEPGEVVLDFALYLAAASATIAVLARLDAALQSVLLIGHNPGLSELATLLRQDRTQVELPTGGLCRLTLPIASWSELAPP